MRRHPFLTARALYIRFATAHQAVTVFGPERIESAVGIEIYPSFCDVARDLWAEVDLDVVGE